MWTSRGETVEAWAEKENPGFPGFFRLFQLYLFHPHLSMSPPLTYPTILSLESYELEPYPQNRFFQDETKSELRKNPMAAMQIFEDLFLDSGSGLESMVVEAHGDEGKDSFVSFTHGFVIFQVILRWKYILNNLEADGPPSILEEVTTKCEEDCSEPSEDGKFT
ncbi:hypothetical protein ACFE04_016273 [Oxalis oulophora]